MNFDLFSHTILLTRAGSRAYGIHTPTSDLDIKGIAIPPVDRYVLGLDKFEQADKPLHFQDKRFLNLLTEPELEVVRNTKLEGSVYELRKFVALALDANPNILDALFCRDEDVLLWGFFNEKPITDIEEAKAFNTLGYQLRQGRNLFLSQKAKFSFSGYAMSQLKRINTHRRWLINPPTHKPTRAEYELPESTLIPQDQLAAAFSMVQKKLDSWELDLSSLASDAERINIMTQLQDTISELVAGVLTNHPDHRQLEEEKFRAAAKGVGIDDNLLYVMDRERRYKGSKTEWDNYEKWKNTRNKDRAALEEQFGYDTKHAGHLYRLMKMCHEILVDGQVNVWRADIDAQQILAIRKGAWSYETLIEFATEQDQSLNALYKTGKMAVPKTPDLAGANELVVSMHHAVLRGTR